MWVPQACTLPTAEQPLRVAEFRDLFATATGDVQWISRTHARLVLTAPRATVEDLIARENQCCAFFTFTVADEGSGLVRLDISVPPAHADVLEALL